MVRNIKNIFLKITFFSLFLLIGLTINAQCHISIAGVDVGIDSYSYSLDGIDEENILSLEWTNGDGSHLCYNSSYEISAWESVGFTLCATYVVENDDLGYCSNTTCRFLEYEECIDESLIIQNAYCTEAFEPVCGCSGITYANVSEAKEYFGVTQYSTGPCLSSNVCVEGFTYFYPQKITNDSFNFVNMSHGVPLVCIWDFGDGNGTVETEDVNVNYTYANPGIYLVTLTRTNFDGITNVFKSFAVTPQMDDICDLESCVWPGDTDGDMYANVYDILNLGIANSNEGSYRPNSSDNWSEQVGPMWYMEVDGVDYKHTDANGDGVVNAGDISIIDDNYCYYNDVDFSDYSTEAPELYLEFDQSTFIINDDSPEFITIEADIVIGSNTNVLSELYGLAFALDYDQEFVAEHVIFDYYDQSFMGSMNEIFTLQKEYFVGGQLDIGITRNNGSNQPGYGVIGRVGWIIESDIIEGRATAEFEVNIDKVKMVNNEGVKLDINPEASIITFIDSTTSTSLNPILDAQSINVYPNPVSDKMMVELKDNVKIEVVKIYSASGALVFSDKVNESNLQIDMSTLIEGVYMVEVQTAFGVVNRKVVVMK